MDSHWSLAQVNTWFAAGLIMSCFAMSALAQKTLSVHEQESAAQRIDAVSQPDAKEVKAREKAARKDKKHNEKAVKKALQDQRDPAKRSQALGFRG
jgi:adenylosuccinate lyase